MGWTYALELKTCKLILYKIIVNILTICTSPINVFNQTIHKLEKPTRSWKEKVVGPITGALLKL